MVDANEKKCLLSVDKNGELELVKHFSLIAFMRWVSVGAYSSCLVDGKAFHTG